MTNFRIKVKINDYFSKIDAIPYDNYICVITCNNCYSVIKLTEHKHQIFQHTLKLVKNMDLLFNLKLINYVDNNTLVGMYDLIIPYSKINQISQRNKSVFKQQVKLIMNSNVKIKLFDYLMTIPDIFLDLIFDFTLINNYSNSIRSKTNQRKISDLFGINEYGNQIKLKESEKIGFNIGFNNNGQIPKKMISFSKSPVMNYNNNFMHNIYGNGFNHQKENIIEENHNHFMKRNNKSDINYNVMNNNFLNYFKIDNNNNFPLNYKYNISNGHHKNNKEPLNQYGNNEIYININNLNNSSISKYKTDAKNDKRFIKINNDNNINYINEKRRQMKNKSLRSPRMNLERRIENEINNNYSNFKNLTEIKNSFESSVIRSEKKKLELNQNKKNLKFQNCENKFVNNLIDKGNYANYINNNMPFSYDKRNYNEKYFSNKLIRKIPNNKNKTNQTQNLNNNGLNAIELPNNKLTYSQIKTPKKLRKSYLNENNPFTISTSGRNNKKEETDKNEHKKIIENNNIYINDESNKNKSTSFYNNNHRKKRINYHKIKISVNQTNTEPEINILGKNYENINITDFNDYENGTQNTSSLNKKNIFQSLSEDNKNGAEQEDNLVPTCTQEEVKDKIIQLIVSNYKLKKEIKQHILTNRKLMKKLILCKTQYYTELKINNRLNNKINEKNIKYSIHVDVHSKLNEKIYFNMKKIKLKESKIFEKIFYEHKNSPEYKAKEAKRKIQEKFEQQKKVHALLKIIRELIQKYDNLSQMYDNDEKKKLLFKSLLVRYGIREKEANKENSLTDKFKELQKKIEDEKNRNLFMMKKQEMQNDVYKNVIKEEDSEEKSSTSERIKIRLSMKQKLSWNSDDSALKEKDSASNNKSKSYNDDINNSILSSGLKIIKEKNEEEFIKDNENDNKGDKKNEKIIKV